jgi:diadenosine tetraphosphate (Ap4A) HIT family hydrolase
MSIITNIGSAQDIKHLHYHLIPKYDENIIPDVDKAYELLK